MRQLEPPNEVDDMSESDLNAMIDAMAAQVALGGSPSDDFSPASQFSPASGSPPSTLPAPNLSSIESMPAMNPALVGGSAAGGGSSLTVSGRVNAGAFKRPAPGLPSHPRLGGSGTTSSPSIAPSTQFRAVSSRSSMEEVSQTSSQRATTPPSQRIRASKSPSPPAVTAQAQPAMRPSREISPTPPILTPSEITAKTPEMPLPATTLTHYSQATLPPGPPPSFPLPDPPFPLPVSPAPQTSEMEFEVIPIPGYEKDELYLKTNFPSVETSMVSPLASSQALDSPSNHGSFAFPGGNKSVDMPLPLGAGPPRRPGEIVLPDSLLPGEKRESPVPPQSPEHGNLRSDSSPPNNVPPSLRAGTHSASLARRNFTGVGSLAHTNKDGSPRLVNSPPGVGFSSAGPSGTSSPSLMPLEPYSSDFGELGGTRGSGTVRKAPSIAGYGQGRFMTNLEDEYKQEKKVDSNGGSGSWR
jgi:hypothetical protein